MSADSNSLGNKSLHDLMSTVKYQELNLQDLVTRNREGTYTGEPLYNDYINKEITKLISN